MTVVHTTNGVSRHNDVITGKILLYMTFCKILQVTFTSMAHLFVWIIWIFFRMNIPYFQNITHSVFSMELKHFENIIFTSNFLLTYGSSCSACLKNHLEAVKDNRQNLWVKHQETTWLIFYFSVFFVVFLTTPLKYGCHFNSLYGIWLKYHAQ